MPPEWAPRCTRRPAWGWASKGRWLDAPTTNAGAAHRCAALQGRPTLQPRGNHGDGRITPGMPAASPVECSHVAGRSQHSPASGAGCRPGPLSPLPGEEAPWGGGAAGPVLGLHAGVTCAKIKIHLKEIICLKNSYPILKCILYSKRIHRIPFLHFFKVQFSASQRRGGRAGRDGVDCCQETPGTVQRRL